MPKANPDYEGIAKAANRIARHESEAMVWAYEVEPANGKWRARQYLNGQLLKCCWYDTEQHAQDACKTWAAVADRSIERRDAPGN
jgi:hypothetical protein